MINLGDHDLCLVSRLGYSVSCKVHRGGIGIGSGGKGIRGGGKGIGGGCEGDMKACWLGIDMTNGAK